MDDIDWALLEAINRLTPEELVARAERAQRRAPVRPMRAWCLCIRASDTRLVATDLHPDTEDAILAREEHDIPIVSSDIARLCKPVRVDWPGMDWRDAADRLGRHGESLRGWMRSGVFKVVRYNARSCGKPGNPVPHVWAPSVLDPSGYRGRGADGVWGTFWQTLHERVPPDLQFDLRRVPDVRRYRMRGARVSERRFRGWVFVCPGLPHGAHCGRLVRRVYFPVPPATLLDFAEEGGQLARVMRRVPWGHAFAPACERCHRVRHVSMTTRQGWNEFVTHISAGLLYGREVARPGDIEIRRKRREYRHERRASARRDRVRELLLTELTMEEIARRMGITRGTVQRHAGRVYREAGVQSRNELRRVECGRERPSEAAGRVRERGEAREIASIVVIHPHTTRSAAHPDPG